MHNTDLSWLSDGGIHHGGVVLGKIGPVVAIDKNAPVPQNKNFTESTVVRNNANVPPFNWPLVVGLGVIVVAILNKK